MRLDYDFEYHDSDIVAIFDDDDGRVVYHGPLRDLVELIDRARADERPVIVLPNAEHDRGSTYGPRYDYDGHHHHGRDSTPHWHKAAGPPHDHHVFRDVIDRDYDPGHRHP